jgi:hypothetical protein
VFPRLLAGLSEVDRELDLAVRKKKRMAALAAELVPYHPEKQAEILCLLLETGRDEVYLALGKSAAPGTHPTLDSFEASLWSPSQTPDLHRQALLDCYLHLRLRDRLKGYWLIKSRGDGGLLRAARDATPMTARVSAFLSGLLG